MNGKKKRTPLTIAKKLEIIKRIESGVRPALICKEFKVAKQTVSDIKKNTSKIKNYAVNLTQNDMFLYTKTIKCHANNALDEDIYKWFQEQISKGLMIGCNDIQNTACKIAKLKGMQNFKGSKPWLMRFLKRNNITKTPEGYLSTFDDGDKLYQLPNNDYNEELHNQESYIIESKGESAYINEVLIKEEVLSDNEEIIMPYDNEENSKLSQFSEVNYVISDEDVWNGPSASYTQSNWGFFDEDKRNIKKALPKMISITKKQRDKLLEYISNHPEVAVEQYDHSSRESKKEHWEELTRHLNKFGPAKPVYQWKKVLYDLKFNMKRSIDRLNNQNETGTDDEVTCPIVNKRYLNFSSGSKLMEMSDSDNENLPMDDRELLQSSNRRETEVDRVYEIQKDTNAKLNIIASSLHRIEDQFASLNHTLKIIAESLPLTPKDQKRKRPKRKESTTN